MPRFVSQFRFAFLTLIVVCGLFIARPLFSQTLPVAKIASGENEAIKKVTFEHDIQPLLTRFGCNAGACHGKARGKNGFALSLLGFDSDFDHDSIVREGRGRRISPASPEMSLLLRKAAAAVPHGGGARFDVGSAPYELLTEWIKGGAVRTPSDAPKLISVIVEPNNIGLAPKESADLKVIAKYSDGFERDVTDAAAFQSNDQTVVMVDEYGALQAGPLPGETAVMARYMNNIAVCSVRIPLPGEVEEQEYESLPVKNEIDRLVWKKLQLLGMLPSVQSDDATFLRRAHLRIIGRAPTPEETLAFISSDEFDKREKLVDRLLERPEYADFWANKWADLLRPNPYRVGMKAVWMMDSWLRESFRENKPYDEFVRELVTARGSTWQNGATVMFRDRPSTVEVASSVSQLFLGVRLECAKCHHHPFEVWSQDDFFGFASFFARVGHHGGLSPPISGGEELIFTKRSGQLNHGRTNQPVEPKTLTGESMSFTADEEPREALANWMTDPENPFFAKVMANRVWADLMGKGFVDPVDDLRATNPASNDELLQFLADDFATHSFNIKHLIRTICTSHVFGLSATPGDRNVSDLKNFSRYYRERLRAEVLLDAINDALDTTDSFAAVPTGSRATQVWTHRSSSLFLDTFGRPDPNQDPPCERLPDSTTPQILHLMNSPELDKKLSSDSARPACLAKSELSNRQIVEEAYLRTFCRRATDEEVQAALRIFPDTGDRRRAVEDLFWALLNTPEFLFLD
ncbi:MAG: DUF1549 domain-containing protein [Planctomycetales bacterium]|nr:DUF1549 domain-containing protein [Planctomycetales bacterium]